MNYGKVSLDSLVPSDLAAAIERRLLELTEYGTYRNPAHALECDLPQTMCFLIDAMPTLRGLFARYPRLGDIRFLDVGPGYGAGGGLLSEMYRSHFLGPRLRVDGLDIHDHRRDFLALKYPLVNLIIGSVFDLPQDVQWDIIYCSNVLEHTDDPAAFVAATMQHTKGFALFMAPYMEQAPLSADHRSQLNAKVFKDHDIIEFRTFESEAWPPIATGRRQQFIAVLKSPAMP